MAGHRQDLGLPISREIDHVEEAELLRVVPVGVVRPAAAARVGRRLEPALRRQDVGPPVAVHVPGADAMAEAAGRGEVLQPRAVLRLVPRERRLRVAELRQHLASPAIVVEVGEDRELDGEAAVDHQLRATRCPGPGLHPGLRYQAIRLANQLTVTRSVRPSPSTSSGRSLKASM